MHLPRSASLLFAFCAAMLFLMLSTQHAAAASPIFVKPNGNGDGSSFANGAPLQHALAIATPGDQIWVAAGIYTPGISVSDTFTLPTGVGVYGGFALTATQFSQRDWLANPTILSGDIGGDDHTDAHGVVTATAAITGVNSAHVVVAAAQDFTGSITSTTRLDGFTITAGQATANGVTGGGGFYCDGSLGYCNPHLENLIFAGNLATAGGAIFNMGHIQASPSLFNVLFTGNTAQGAPTSSGGAMYNFGNGGVSSPSLINVSFIGNSAHGAQSGGGAMYNEGFFFGGSTFPALVNVLFSGNSVDQDGGAFYNVSVLGGGASFILINTTFSGNSAGHEGGAIFQPNPSLLSTQALSNVILWGNTATVTEGEQIDAFDSTLDITTSLVQGSITGTGVLGSVVAHGVNLNADPRFVNAAHNNLRLQGGSPAIDAGTNSAISQATDLDGNPRKIDGDGNLTVTVDMGAYEFQDLQPLTVTLAGNGSGQVVRDPLGAPCDAPCSALYVKGTVVTLTAGAGITSTFTGWSAPCSGTGACQLTMDAAKQVTATFTAPTTGDLQGKVKDSQGKALPGATVSVNQQSDQLSIAAALTQTTDSAGHYLFTDLSPGNYTVTAGMSGKQTSAPVTVTVHAAATTTVSDITLQPIPASKPQLHLPLLANQK